MSRYRDSRRLCWVCGDEISIGTMCERCRNPPPPPPPAPQDYEPQIIKQQ